MIVKLLIEGLVMCGLITLFIELSLRKGAINWVFLYEQEVQDKVILLGMTTKEKIQKNKKTGAFGIFGIAIACLVISIGLINHPASVKECFLQLFILFQIYNIYDGVIIDELWVMHTDQWFIEGTEEFRDRYIPNKKRVKRLLTVIVLFILIFVLSR